MTEQRERMENALRGCAKAGMPGTVDLWPEIREQVAAEPRRRSRRTRFLPRTRVGWAFAALMAMFVASTGAVATGGITDVLGTMFEETVPYVYEHELGKPIEEKNSRDGVTVSLDRVYADSAYVVVGFHVEGLGKAGDQPNDPRDDLLADAGLSDPAAGRNGKKFDMVDGYWRGWAPPDEVPANLPTPPKGAQVGTVVFESPTKLKPGENHRLRVRVGLFRGGSQEPILPFYVFDLKVPVKATPAIEVNQTVESNGVPITLTEVVNSPAKTSAYLCFDPPQRKYDWPLVKTRPFEEGRLADAPVYHIGYAGAKEGCAQYTFDESLYGRPGTHSLTVSELVPSETKPRGTIEGTWRFRFEVPDAVD